MKRLIADITLTIALGVVALLLGLNLSAMSTPVHVAEFEATIWLGGDRE